MKFKTDLVYNLKVIFIICCAIVLFYFLFSNVKICGSIAYHFAFGDNKIEGASYKTIIEKLPAEFEDKFSKFFKQRDSFTAIHDNLFFNVFKESSSAHFYLRAPKETQLAFLSHHTVNDKFKKNRFNLFFNVLQGGYGDPDDTVEKVKENLLLSQNFLDNYHVPIALLVFPTKHFLQYDMAPKAVIESLGHEVYDNPVQLRIINSLPDEFRERYIINIFPEAIHENNIAPLFPQYNFHWAERSHYTNFVAARIAQKFGLPDAEPVPIEEYELEDTISDMKHLTNINLEEKPFLRLPIEKYDALGVQKTLKTLNTSHVINPNGTKKIVILGDSFTRTLGMDLALYFKEVWAFGNYQYNEENLLFIQNEYNPDYIVFLGHVGLFAFNDYISFFEKTVKENPELQ